MSGHENLERTHIPGAWKIHGQRNKGRGRGITAASRAGQSDADTWLVRYDPIARNGALRKLQALDEGAPPDFREALLRAAAPFKPYVRPKHTRRLVDVKRDLKAGRD